jgi:hypothetical protein
LAEAGRVGGEESMRAATARLGNELEGAGPKVKLLRLLVNNQDRLDAAGVEDLARKLVAHMTTRRQFAPELGMRLGEIRIDDPHLRGELVGRLMEGVDGQSAPGQKRQLLLAAKGLAGSDQQALQPVEKRIAKLRASSDLADRNAAAVIDEHFPT